MKHPSAAAGMLAPFDPETLPALRPLAIESARLFPEYVRKFEAAAQLQVDFRRLGTIAFLETNSAPPEYKVSPLTISNVSNHRSAIPGHSAYFVQEDSVDPRLLMLARLGRSLQGRY